MKTIECLNENLPVLMAEILYQHDIITQRNSGLVCEFNKADIAEKMKLMASLNNLEEMGKLGRKYVWQIRHYQKIAEIIVDCYNEILNRNKK